MPQQAVITRDQSSTLSDVLERCSTKGIVIARRQFKIKLVDSTSCSPIQIRLVICSVDKGQGDGHGLVGQQPRLLQPGSSRTTGSLAKQGSTRARQAVRRPRRARRRVKAAPPDFSG